jgi:hypothetical protein
MNQIEKEFFGLLDMTHKVRDSGLAALSDEDLAFRIPGCPTVGDLVVELGDVEFAYTRSFSTFVLRFESNAPGREQVTNAAAAIDWLHGLDVQLKEALAALSDTDLSGKQVERGGWKMPVIANFHTYREALLILLGKLDLYLKALGKELPETWTEWLG